MARFPVGMADMIRPMRIQEISGDALFVTMCYQWLPCDRSDAADTDDWEEPGTSRSNSFPTTWA